MTGSLPRLVAVVGLTGAGKSSAVGILERSYDYHRVYFGGVVVDEVRRRGLDLTPENERRVREELRETEGLAVVAARLTPSITCLLDAGTQRVVIDGIYSPAELEYLRDHIDEHIITIAIHAPRWLRKARLASRESRPLSPDEVDRRDFSEVNNLGKAVPIATADLHVVNDGGLDRLEKVLVEALCTMQQHLCAAETDGSTQ